MSFPVIFHIGKASLHAHLVFEVLAYSLGFRKETTEISNPKPEMLSNEFVLSRCEKTGTVGGIAGGDVLIGTLTLNLWTIINLPKIFSLRDKFVIKLIFLCQRKTRALLK
jgi:hypothetical protein